MKNLSLLSFLFAVYAGLAQEKAAPSPVVFRPSDELKDEKPVVIETTSKIAADNGFFRRVETLVTFTNPNGRVFEGELEFPVPEGATVCGYQLEVNGSMVPGVVVAKEEARVAFENERRKGVDPGLVENVKGNVWRTRIYPLTPGVPRKAMVAYIVAHESVGTSQTLCEKFGDEIFAACGRKTKALRPVADRLRDASEALVYWDASLSRKGKVAADRKLLESLPATGKFTLVVFRNVLEAGRVFDSRAALLEAVDGLVYDGGTCLDEVLKRKREKADGAGRMTFLFSDAYREPKPRAIEVRKLAAGETPPTEPKEGTLLATAWAANRVEDLAGDAEAHRAELVEIGRKYGIASSVTSLIVLERLDQYKTYRIEPPKCMSFYEAWKKWRAAEDDPIAAERAKADHRQALLRFWEERVKWWNDPIPPKTTPKSGLFDGSVAVARSAVQLSAAGEAVNGARVAALPEKGRRAAPAASTRQATVKLAAWDPKMPYLKAIGEAAPGCAYEAYLNQREVYGSSPAFYLDCAGWFFKAGERLLAVRIISNLSEIKLEDTGMWRTMGWRLREAGVYDEAVNVFRHVLGERAEEPQSRRDLALILTERGKDLFARGDRAAAARDLAEAMKLLYDVAFVPTARRSGRRGNDLQTSVFALEELNGLISWIAARDWQDVAQPVAPALEAFRRDLPLDLRITLSWDTDETDVDLHVLEPDGEEAFYGHRRTSTGGFVSEDVTTGYGPEEYLRKTAPKGVYRILANYYSSHRQALTGAAVVTATVYTGWGRRDETRQILSFRLDKPREKCPIGEIKVD